LLPSALGVGGVIGVLMLVYGAFSYVPVDPTSPGAVAPVPTTTTPSPATTSAGTPGVVTSTSPPVGQPSGPPAATPTTTTPTVDPRQVSVEVRNSTSVGGLAGRLSDYLGGLGWAMRDPGNFSPPLDKTTIFYPAGLEDGARALAALVPGDDAAQVKPADSDDLAVDAVTVVVGEDAADWSPPD
jgi:hypothetical protein